MAKNALAEAINSDDHTTTLVPLSQRRGPFTLGLLWITMVTGFPAVLGGFDWYRGGLTLAQILTTSFISSLILLAYCIPACQLGALSGQTYALLSRRMFGRLGSIFVSLNLSWISLGWYGLAAFLLADGLKGVLHLPMDTALLSFLLALVMSVNNLFGFSGIASFAGYLAAPILIGWVGVTFTKAAYNCPVSAFMVQPHQSLAQALTLVSAFVIGNSAWGNEPDYWRYAKPRLSYTVIPLIVSLVIGQIIFPVTGWMLARQTGITDYAGASGLMTRYAFGDSTLLAGLLLVVMYFALNDANLYAAINGIANLGHFSRQKLTIVLTLIGACAASLLCKSSHSFEAVASLSSTVLPCATVIMMAEWFLLARLHHLQVDFSSIPSLQELPRFRWSAVISLALGCSVGIATAGIIPGWERFHIGVCSLQAWLTSLITYLAFRFVELSLGRFDKGASDHELSDLHGSKPPLSEPQKRTEHLENRTPHESTVTSD